ncbi:glutathione S-transferase 1-1-like [Calliopsis andreniformis]|uniref:glutathione S-transferase 1-1-like n=1 Tax=Calliopsis andreniformis TaxID=337506 RepID=UPI003FCCDF30
MPKPVLYSLDESPPCHHIYLVAQAIGLELELRKVNLFEHENLKEEFLKINPRHTIPTLDDDGFILSDSHAISIYLLDKYAEDDSLYPKDPQKRALVNQFLFFDADNLFTPLKAVIKPLIFDEMTSIPEPQIKAMQAGCEMLNTYLEGKTWLVGDSYTIADISCVTTVSVTFSIVNLNDYPNVKTWMQRCEAELPGYKEDISRFQKLYDFITSTLK